MDNILRGFLEAQHAEAKALANDSDTLELRPFLPSDGSPPQCYLAKFNRCGLICLEPGKVQRAPSCLIGIKLDENYLRGDVSAFAVVTLIEPASLFHSNARFPFLCLGSRFLKGGTPLVEVLYRLYQIVSYQLWTAEDPLNEAAAQWLRNHQDQVPLTRAGLKRRRKFEVHLTSPVEVKS